MARRIPSSSSRRLGGLIGAVAACLVFPGQALAAQDLLIEHVTVVPMTAQGGALPDSAVLVRDGRIAYVGPARNAPNSSKARRIDGRGKWLMPALADMHVHIENDRMMRGLFGASAVPIGTVRTQDVLTPYVANGVLQVMNMSSDPDTIAQRDAVESGAVVGPHIALAAMVDGDPPLQSPVLTQIAVTPSDGRQIVRSMKWSGYDVVKVYGALTPEVFDAVVDEAVKQKMKVAGHIPGLGKTPVERFFRPGYGMVAHAEEFTREGMKDADIPRYVEMARRNGTWLTSTLALDETILAQTRDPDVLKSLSGFPYLHPTAWPMWFQMNRYFSRRSPERIAALENQVRYTRLVVKAFVDGGVPVVAGTDTLVPGMAPGFALHDELAALVRAGLSNEQALASATRLPAEWLGVADDRGVAAEGKRADLLLLDADPLADVANTRRISAVIANGRYLPRAELDAMMADLAKRYAATPKLVPPPPPPRPQS